MRGVLVLEDGTTFEGEAFGAAGKSAGEVVFNTGMTGYQEVLTDPSYCGQIVTMTYPLVGNYGINAEDSESRRLRVRGFIVRERCAEPSHWRSTETLGDYLFRNGIIGLSGIDTRALTRHLRNAGTMKGVIASMDTQTWTPDELVGEARAFEAESPVHEVTTPCPYRIFGDGPKVTVIDYGLKTNILRCLGAMDCDITVVPAETPYEDLLEIDADGILLSNGPGDPKAVPGCVETVRKLIGWKPIFGICLGHQILGLALGAGTYKLKYGHRGANHPVKDLATGRIQITAQNHGYAIDEESLVGLEIEVTHRNLNDGTVEGMSHRKLPVFSVQYHPEAAPGPEDSRHLFERFMAMMVGPERVRGIA